MLKIREISGNFIESIPEVASLYGEESMTARGEGRPLHACVIIVRTSVVSPCSLQLLFSAVASKIVSNKLK